VPLETDLPVARRTRDEGWQLIKHRYVLGEPTDLSAYAPDGDAATVYEGQVADSDQIADLLRHESQKVIQHARLESELQQVRDELAENARLLGDHGAQRDALQEEWRTQWIPTAIAPLSPEEMREWLRRLESLRAAVMRVGDFRQERKSAQEALVAAGLSVATELAKLGYDESYLKEPLAALVEVAERLLEDAQATRDARSQLTRRLQDGRLDEQRRQQDVARAELALQQWAGKWTDATRILGMGEQPAVEQATAVLRVFRELNDDSKEAAALERRLSGIERDATAFQQDVERLVRELAPEFADLAPVDATRQLQARLVAARQARTLLDRLNAEIEGHEAEIADSEEALRIAQTDLDALANLAQCDVADLEQIWKHHEHRRSLEGEIAATQEQLISTGDGKSIRELQAEATGIDGDAIRVRLEALTDEIATANEDREEQRKTAWELERILTSLDGSAAASEKADERQALLAEMRDEVEQYLTLAVARQLLVQGIETYRAANQAPMLQRASTFFAEMTGDAFSGLNLEYGDADNPVLVGVRATTDERVKVGGMSDGTCDQLYLALRLAAIEQFSQEAEPLPLIVDDILIRFDDERARETLKVLGEISRHNQVIFFTHHRRLTQLADEVFGEGKYGRVDLPV
ncbi:MAG: ATP-binding protein, partial [Bacteroidota bacterium]